MDRFKELIDQLWFTIPFGFWAIAGYVAHTLQSPWPGWRNWTVQLVTVFIAGATVGLLLAEAGMSEFVKCGICSCVGMSGGKIIQDLQTWMRRKAEKIIVGEAPHGPNDTMED